MLGALIIIGFTMLLLPPFLDYGISIWGSAASIYLERLFKLQNCAIKLLITHPS